jgi:uncharacterized protein (TIGR00255 family)
MTGYGKSTLNKNDRNYIIEIKSVNHRYLDINIKIPRTISYLEEEIKKEISKTIKRGKVDVFITFENNSDKGRNIQINTEIAKLYINELRKLAKQENLLDNIEVTEISKLPDVLTIKNDSDDEEIKKEVLQTTQETVRKLMDMKDAEGEKILQDLLQRIKNIEATTLEISKLSTGLIEEYVVKLESRIKELLDTKDIDKSRIAQEVVIYADKCSVEEEITRLKSHIEQFRRFVKSNEPVGKKLDFLIQEMNRETNTIGSKANNLEITNKVIELKTELENIREQIQNIE